MQEKLSKKIMYVSSIHGKSFVWWWKSGNCPPPLLW